MNDDIDILEYIETLKADSEDRWDQTQVTEQKRINKDSIYKQTPHWLKITGGIVAVYADMINSSSVNITRYRHIKQRGRVFDVFTGGLARIFHDFNVVHLDIEGDGALGIWNGGDDRLKAFCAAVTFRTFVDNWLTDFVKANITDIDSIGVRIGMDEEIACVKFVGVRGEDKNLVWTGEPVPSASKLCKTHEFKNNDGEVIDPLGHIAVSDRLYANLKKIEEIELSCGCSNGEEIGEKKPLWSEYEIPEDRKEEFNFEKYAILRSTWCNLHGTEYCQNILSNITDD